MSKRYEDSDPCRVCLKESNGRDKVAIICDDCNANYHLSCIDPPMRKVPSGSWSCRDCAPGVTKKRMTATLCEDSQSQPLPKKRMVEEELVCETQNKPDVLSESDYDDDDSTIECGTIDKTKEICLRAMERLAVYSTHNPFKCIQVDAALAATNQLQIMHETMRELVNADQELDIEMEGTHWSAFPFTDEAIERQKTYPPSIVMMACIAAVNFMPERYFCGNKLAHHAEELAEIVLKNGEVVDLLPAETKKETLFTLIMLNPEIITVPQVKLFSKSQ